MEILFSKDPIEYQDALKQMELIVDQIHDKSSQEKIWFLEHESVYTAGTSAKDDELLSANILPVHHVGRGGKYTYHGPQMRVVYLMLDLKKRGQDLRKYIVDLEQLIIDSLKILNIESFRCDGRIGIWTEFEGTEYKIASIGIRVKKWISYHGISINYNPEMQYFNHIIPCGIKDYSHISLKKLNPKIEMGDLDNALMLNIDKIFGCPHI